MLPKLKTFIEEHIDLIEQKRWQALYSYATAEIPFQIGNLSYNLLQAGINPLEDLNRILPEMFCNAMELHEIKIPSNITRIMRQAFMNCYYLTKITIPKSITNIEDTAFSGCYDLADIEYEGTTTEFLNIISPNSNLFEDTKNGIVSCSDAKLLFDFDGTIKLIED